MPSKCCVPFCKGNYESGPKVAIFRFPKDEKLAKQWITAIKRDNFTPSKHSRVCELHFTADDVEVETSYFDERSGRRISAKLEKPRLRKGAVPSKLPKRSLRLSTAVSLRESPDARTCRKEEAALGKAIIESVADDLHHKQQRQFETIDELLRKLTFQDEFWTILKQEDTVLICHIARMPYHKITLSVEIDKSHAVKVFVREVEMQKLGSYDIPLCINDVDSLEDLLTNLKECNIEEPASDPDRVIFILQLVISLLSLIQEKSSKHIHTVKVICEQLHLMTLKKVEYSSEFMIFSSLLYNCSPQGYRLLRNTGYLILPSYTTIRKLTQSQHLSSAAEQLNSNFLSYIKNKFQFLAQTDTTVTLMMNEIHIKQYFDYKCGNVRSAFNSTEAANSAFVFMIKSLLSQFKDVVHILLVNRMQEQILFNVIKQIITGLEQIGFRVICVVTDNKPINSKAMSYFHSPPLCSTVYRHPTQNQRPLFFLYDSAHIFKCIRNNWINQKDADKCMEFPEFSFEDTCDSTPRVCKAPFTTLKQLHSVEADSLLKHAYRLTLKSLSPSYIERQNVSLVTQIFNGYIIEALLSLGEMHNLSCFEDIAKYIKIIHDWWTVMNVKFPHEGQHLKNNYAAPLTKNEDDGRYLFLHYFLNWLDIWNGMKEVTGKLTHETFTALKHTTTAILQITDYCISELDMKYVLPGKFQSDHLEARFGKYRQLAGASYNISVRQVFECEKKLRMSLLRIPIHNQSVELKVFEEIEWEHMETDDLENLHRFDVEITENDIENCMGYQQVLTYIAGYCCFAVLKKVKCEFCKDLITCNDDIKGLPDNHSYIHGISRGSLLYPDDAVVNIIMYNYLVINKLSKHPEFIKSLNHRNLATKITVNILIDNYAFLPMNDCDDGHNIEKIQRMLLWASTNTMLDNFCAKENGLLNQSKWSGKKRKLQTFT